MGKETQQEHSLIITGVNEEDSNVVQGEQITPEELKTLALLIKKIEKRYGYV